MSPPIVGPKPSKHHFQVIGVKPSHLSHEKTQGDLMGGLPKISSELADPTVSAGLAEWKGLTEGGLFNFYKKSIVVEALSDATWKIGRFDGTAFQEMRSVPVVPFKLCPGEVLQATGKPKAFCVVRLDTKECL